MDSITLKRYFANYLNNLLINEFLSSTVKNIVNEIGTIINENSIDFHISIESNCRAEIENIIRNPSIRLSRVLKNVQLQYSYGVNLFFYFRRFTKKEIKNFTYFYFTSEATENRYIFKYHAVNSHLRNLLEKNELWFSSPVDFPDITDCKFEIETEPSEKNIADFYRKQGRGDILSQIDRVPPKPQFNKDLLDYHSKGVMSKLGIACFTEKYDNKLMWDRYGDGYKGVCLVFDLSTNAENHYQFYGRKVRYLSSPVKYFFDGSGTMEIGHIVHSKLKTYAYEHEVREMINFQFRDSEKRNIKFNPSALKGVIFGPDCSPKNKDLIRQIVYKKYNDIELIDAFVDNKLNIKLDKHKIRLKEKRKSGDF